MLERLRACVSAGVGTALCDHVRVKDNLEVVIGGARGGGMVPVNFERPACASCTVVREDYLGLEVRLAWRGCCFFGTFDVCCSGLF
jgi:hypothetical protein